ncbi:isoaspartyl peptidase/L-asparaginase [Marivirga sp. S37H4]|uniref:Isoaspartyl peptidase n=1 Tax=Marivirga aurantiaca TaxID=2802615 RepID=A0A934WVG6_9BACT|nr:isoaspartyl peptidase/L-asparaginase [Marivirga aurantiaca]MBK6263671.1 isoaspartyl peptidase/L-asparaginase [Marivirga aurantiaca]
MKKYYLATCIAALFFIGVACEPTEKEKSVKTTEKDTKEIKQGPITLVIHGGAGTIRRENMTEEQDSSYRAKLTEALEAGYAVLEKGEPAMSAIIAAIQIMEESPLFNAGRGSVFTSEGKNEMDAAVMQGKTRDAGTVAGVTNIKSPISAALAVMEKSPHVMMTGPGAEQFAKEQGLEIVDPSYFFVQSRYDALQRIKEREAEKGTAAAMAEFPDSKFGTVGCVALDKDGNIAAGTSTGGMTNKKYGRVGDVPIIGGGTYADNATCGVSATGHGEYFIRSVVAYDIAAKMKYLKKSLEESANEVVMEELVDFGGSGGVIALDRQGNISMPFNSEGMYRGYMNAAGSAKVFIYADEKE